ncbi:uncharacterized protein TNCV_3298971 [Trichonephila clavipes]|uniref:Uncharacterized protein n=1 Tax=Trichonephila clavipes TaxID=2585209 RepID=A0A8X6VTP0_TRICX|nr:uncharacterized protein TNCV_3298971 [Trichonephila clavipes]
MVVRNKAMLEARFYASRQTKSQNPVDFVYELLKLQKALKLEMTELNLIQHIVSRLEPQVQDYVEKQGPSENFSRRYRRHGGRLNILKVQDDQDDQSQSVKDIPIRLSAICMSPVELPYAPILLDETFTKALWDTGVDFISESKIILDFDTKLLAIQDLQIEDNTIQEGNLSIDISETKLNVVANVSYKNSVESIVGENVACALIRDLVLSSREHAIEEQRRYPELGHIYRYLENPEDSSVNATIYENWSRDFRLVESLLFYAKYATTEGEMRMYIPQSLRGEIMLEFLSLMTSP